jgi:hypothetical protein
MPEYRASYTLSIDVEIFFEADDEDAADELADAVGEAATLALHDPTPQEIGQVEPSLKDVVKFVSYDGPYGHELNDGPWEDE